MSDATFEQIAEEVLKIKQRMEKLQAENDGLRQQLADLREGRGIFLDIHGQRFALRGETVVDPQLTSISSEAPAAVAEEQSIIDAPTMANIEIPLPETVFFEQDSEQDSEQDAAHEQEQVSLANAPTFLEEMLVDEFTSAASNGAIWEDPDTQKQPSLNDPHSAKDIDEDQKAALRKALVGSFLLE